MTVEDETRDIFPVGMRVLAVDDDLTCLRLLESLLRRCQYQVTTTNQAITALKMLRENKDKFDLVISDVHMPDMDGFKLLELVGLELDLPVIMLSANSDPKLVMKGITHGACDYLLKPIRIEELKNIWQHVIRRKKNDQKDQNRSTNQQKARHGTGDGGVGPGVNGNSDESEKLINRKRKDQNEEEEEESEEDGHENEDPSTQKKPRVVWSVELHQKFVAAVNQLGIEKAVPKRILDLMNVERLSRENVASHLQKYRLYLKRISSVGAQQANMVAALGAKDSSYMRLTHLDGLGDFHTMGSMAGGPARLPSHSISSYLPSGMLGRLNTPTNLGLRGLTSPGQIQPAQAQNPTSSINTFGKVQPSPSLFQGIPTSLELDHLQHSKPINHVGDFNPIDDPTVFSVTCAFTNARVTASNSINPLILQANQQPVQNRGGFVNQSSIKMGSVGAVPFEIGVSGSSNFLDYERCNENWQNAVELSQLQSNTLPLREGFNHDQFADNLRNNMASSSPQIRNNPFDFSTNNGVLPSMEDKRGNMIVQDMNPRQDYSGSSSIIFGTVNSSIVPPSGVMGPLSHSLDHVNMFCDIKMNPSQMGQLKSGDSLQGGFARNSCDSLEDLVSAMIKREQNDSTFIDGDFGFGSYSLD